MTKISEFFKAVEGIGLVLRHGPAMVVEWKKQSVYDELTGLYNRRFFWEIWEMELAKAKRLEWQGVSYPVSIIMIDIDCFKEINDREGHENGDETLRRVAALLKRICRRGTDIVGGRFGGDEFIILLPQTTREGAQTVADRLENLAEELVSSPGGRPIGLSCGSAEGIYLKEMLIAADFDMFEKKKSKFRL